MIFDIAFSFSVSVIFGLTALYVTIARRHKSTWKVGVVLLLACAEITVAHTLQISSPGLESKAFWYKMSLVGFTLSATSFFSLALQYTKADNKIEPRTLLFISIFPILTIIIILTNEIHGLMWNPASTPIVVEKLYLSASEAGIWYWFFVVYSFLIMGLGCFTLVRWIAQSQGFYSRQALGVVIAAGFAMLGGALDIFHASIFPPFIATAIGLSIGTVSAAFALIPLRRHDVLWISRRAIVNDIHDCIIVVDSNEQIVLVNRATEELVKHPSAFMIGKPLKQFIPALSPISGYRTGESNEKTFQIQDKPIAFSLRVTSIKDWNYKVISHVIVLHNITDYKQAEQKLLRSEAGLMEAQRITHVGSWEWDLTKDKVRCSEEMFRIAGRVPMDEIGQGEFKSFLPPGEAEEVFQRIQQNTGASTIDVEHSIIRPGGEIRMVHSRIKAYRDEHGKPMLLLGSTQDITERKQTEAQIQLQITALESAANGIIIADRDGKILWANPSLTRMTGYSFKEISDQYMSLFDYGSKDSNIVREMRETISKNNSWTGEMVNTRKDGMEYVVDMTITPVANQRGEITHYIAIFQDVTERVEAQKQLEFLATHDPLTQLPNRILFSDRLNHALTVAKRTGNQGAVLFVDLDDFKSVNDVFSHTIGDELLRALSKRIRGALRESDTVARIGGDEFAILLEDIDQFNVDIVAQKIIQAVSGPTKIVNDMIIITASIGISIFPQDGDTIHALLKNADLAMYQAKDNNKNRFEFFNQEMASKIEGQMDLLNYMRYALKNDLFKLYYQPQVDCKTGAIVGVEALLRLPHPTKKWIPPSEFIPLAEKTDIILSLDEWVIKTACREKRDLLDTGIPDFNLSLNISNHQLGQDNLIELVKGAIRVNNLNPGSLELEISESSAFQNADITIKTLNELKKLGIRIAIDDFGKGYSSLNYLANFPLDSLKIDLSFAQRIPYSHNDVGIVKGIIAIAKSLGMDVVVEGVEKREQLDFFMSNGCKFVQGNYYSQAITVNEIAKILRSGF
ncbi:MAG: EAL domain-containing protein [Anaerolineaceae bacterium]|nr:MAG: EAL domain-containing protein [Anaerolineaceae bacterium]